MPPLAPGLAILLLGVAGDLLFNEAALGLNVVLWVAMVAWVWWRLRQGQSHPLLADERRLLLLSLALGLGWVWRENPMLRLLDALGLAVTAALLALVARPSPVALTPGSLTRSLVAFAGRMAAGWLPTMIDASRSPRPGVAGRAGAVARGALIAVPSLLLFGALLGQADQAFGRFLEGLVRVDPEVIAVHTVTMLGLAWAAAAVVLGTRGLPEGGGPFAGWAGRGLGAIEVVMVLAPLNLLFLAFVGFQLPYLFGGLAFVAQTAGVTLAEYARRGFFELCVVAGLLLPLLLFLEARVPGPAGRARRLLRLLAGTQAALLLAILASALHRMVLYQREFGLTQDRLFATAFIGGIGVTTCWFVATALQGAPMRFMRGALAGWVAWLALLHAVNPERVIVEVNVRRAQAGQPFDAAHLAGLGDDALPALVAALPRMPAAERGWLAVRLSARTAPANGDVRGWTIARARAAESLRSLRAGAPGESAR